MRSHPMYTYKCLHLGIGVVAYTYKYPVGPTDHVGPRLDVSNRQGVRVSLQEHVHTP